MSMSSCRSSLLAGAALSAMRLRRISMVRIVAGEESSLLLLQKSAKASWISLSSSPEMSFSLASLDRRLEVEVEEVEAEAAGGALRLGGCVIHCFAVRISDDYFVYEVCDRYVADLP